MGPRRLEVEIYQIADHSMMKKTRTDGLGWEWCWADWQRDWMNATPHRYAYRCLPLTIMNQTGWWIKNPVGFTATWRGASRPDSIDYFQGRDATGRQAATLQMQKIKPPIVRFRTIEQAVEVASSACDAVGGSRELPDERDDASLPRFQTSCPVEHRPQAGDQDMNPKIGEDDRSTVRVQPAGHIPRGPAANPPLGFAQHNGSGRNVPQQSSDIQADVIAQTRIDDEWRRWIAENLMIGEDPESILDAMKSAGFSREESAHEIKSAQESPYVKGSELIRNRLKKRDWLLAVYRKNNRLHPQSGAIERRHRLSRLDFLCDYYSTNRPVVITGMMDDWPAMRKWNLDYFARSFGEREVEVQMGRAAGADYEIERQKYISKVRFGSFIGKVRSAGETNDFYLTANNNSSNRKVLSELWDDIVQIPEYLAANRPGGFFWMGPRGTITPFHHDLTNNFMAQVIGRKRVKIAQSWDMPLMRNYLHCFSRVDGRVVTPGTGPAIDEPRIDEVVLNPGEVLFLPIGCLHYVQGIEISVTVSFTNFVFDNDYASFYATYGPV